MKYLYTGPTSGVTLQEDGKAREVMLHTGAEVELPEENEYIKTLVALNHLEPLPQAKATKVAARNSGEESKGA